MPQESLTGMTWAKFSDDFADECAGLSDAAFRTHVEGILWSMRRLTGGRIEERDLRRFAETHAPRRAVDELVNSHPPGSDTPFWRPVEAHVEARAWNVIHGMQEQRSPEQIIAERQATRLRVEQHRLRNAASNGAGNSVSNSVSNTTQTRPDLKRTTTSSNTPSALARFDEFYAAYPRHVGRADAEKAWRVAVSRGTPDRIIAASRKLAADPNLPEARYIPHPATWLRQARWDDDPLPPRGPEPGPGRDATPDMAPPWEGRPQ